MFTLTPLLIGWQTITEPVEKKRSTLSSLNESYIVLCNGQRKKLVLISTDIKTVYETNGFPLAVRVYSNNA